MRPGKKQARALTQYDFGVTDSGNEYVQLTFQIVGGAEDGETIGYRGFFTDATVERTMESLRYCGWKGDNVTDLTGIGDNLVQLVVENEEYEGKTYARVKWVNKLGIGVKNAMSQDARASFAARMKAHAIRADKSLADGVKADSVGAGGGMAATGTDDGDPGFTDDDVPF